MAVYLAFDGEPDLTPLADAAVRRGKQLFVPTLERSRMRFAPLGAREALAANFFGILEPRSDERIDPRCLDLVLTPLVAFDSHGTRLGVGAGYYDRAFRFLLGRKGWRRPKLLGVAYELQHVAHLEARAWDVPLWAAVTEAGVQRFDGT